MTEEPAKPGPSPAGAADTPQSQQLHGDASKPTRFNPELEEQIREWLVDIAGIKEERSRAPGALVRIAEGVLIGIIVASMCWYGGIVFSSASETEVSPAGPVLGFCDEEVIQASALRD